MINPSKYYLVLQDRVNGDIFRGISHGRNIGDKFDFNQKPVKVLFVGNKKESVQHFKQLKGRKTC